MLKKIQVLRKKLIVIFIFILVYLVCISCQITFIPQQIFLKKDSIEIKWDPPELQQTNVSIPVQSYKIYYKTHGSDTWILLNEIPYSEKPYFKINKKELEPGMYDFAVSAVYENSRESILHSSLDNTAKPTSGWYLLWIHSN